MTRSLERQDRALGWMFAFPSLAFITLVVVFPITYGLYLSVMGINLAAPGPRIFLGLGNYFTIFTSERFWHDLGVSLFIVAAGVAIQLLIGLALATYLAQRDFRGKSLVVALFLIPTTIAPVVIGFMFQLLYSESYGPLNYLLNLVHLPSVRWLSSAGMAPWSIILANVWEWTPFIMLGLIAAIYTIPNELFDAAHVDGARSWQTYLFVVLPLIEPTMITLAVIRAIEDFKLFDIIFVLTGGGPGISTENLNMYAYIEGFQYFRLGFASALSFIQLALILLLTRVLYVRATSAKEGQ